MSIRFGTQLVGIEFATVALDVVSLSPAQTFHFADARMSCSILRLVPLENLKFLTFYLITS